MTEEEVSTVNDIKSSPYSCKEKNSSLITSSTAEEDVQLDYQENEEEINPHNGSLCGPTEKLDDSSNVHKTELQSPDIQNIEEEEEPEELVQQDALEDLEHEENLELRSLNDEGDVVDEPENGEVKNVEEKKRPRTPPFPCPDADEADEDEEEELQEEVADDENEEKEHESTEEADPVQKAGDLKKRSRSREKDRSPSRRDRPGVPKAYQMSRKPERRNGGAPLRPRRRLPTRNGASDSVEFRLAANRRKRLKRLRAARLQRVTELGRRRGNKSPPPTRRGIGRRSDDFRDKRRRSRSRSPLRRGRLSPSRRPAIPSLMSTRVRTPPPPRRFNDSRRYSGYSGRRSRSPPPRRMSTDRRPLRRPEAAGPSRPAFVGNDQYRIYINNDNSDRRPRRPRSPPPRHGRFEPYNSRDRGGRMDSVRRDKIPSLLSLRTSPPPVMRGGSSSRRSPMRSRGRSPPLRSYVRGEDRNRSRSSRFPNKCPPRQRSP
uniref:Uncharacterized protein n=1 Tax=Ditylenchus dipsaci TaxID=166011 RepID=A0A915DG92_9BILA